MQRLARWTFFSAILSILSILEWESVAAAQMPVCPQPDLAQPMYTACRPGGRFAAARFLSDLAIDQLLRADAKAISREPRALFRSVASADTIEGNAALDEYLGRLPALALSRLDTATGTLRMDVPEGERTFSSSFYAGDTSYPFHVELPARIEGAYWRTPGVLQLAFWKGQGVRLRIPGPDGSEIQADFECLVVSGDGLRLVTSGETPDILIGFDLCQ